MGIDNYKNLVIKTIRWLFFLPLIFIIYGSSGALWATLFNFFISECYFLNFIISYTYLKSCTTILMEIFKNPFESWITLYAAYYMAPHYKLKIVTVLIILRTFFFITIYGFVLYALCKNINNYIEIVTIILPSILGEMLAFLVSLIIYYKLKDKEPTEKLK